MDATAILSRIAPRALRDRPAAASEVHVFVLWSNARPLQDRILADLGRRFTVLDVTELAWQADRFSESLTCFYGTALPPGSDKERTCGTGPPLAIVVEDRDPRYGLRRTTRGLARVNVRTFGAKRRYRRWTGGSHRVHATQDQREAERDLYLLVGRRPSSYATTSWDGSIRTEPGELFGADGWGSVGELCTAFELSLPYVLLGDAALLKGREEEAERLVVLADERWEPAMVARGMPLDDADDTRRRLVNVDGRPLVCEFMETGEDKHLQMLLAGRVRSRGGYWVPGEPAPVHEAPVRAAPVRAATPAAATPQAWLDTLIALTVADMRSRYGRGAFRVVKWLVDPIAALGVYLALVAFAVSKRGPDPGLSIACAVIPFQLIVGTAVNAMSSIHIRRNVVLNMGFDRTLIPVSSVLTETVVFLADFVLIAAMMALYGRAPTIALLWLPLVLAANVLFAVGLAYPATIFGVWYSDLRLFGVSVIRTLFFLAAGLLPLAEISGKAHTLVQLNPLTEVFESYRAVFLYGRAPRAFDLLYPALAAALLLLAFLPLYAREQRQFAKVVD
jgi:ABC-type polysaccharide/polyol phosphate export permease